MRRAGERTTSPSGAPAGAGGGAGAWRLKRTGGGAGGRPATCGRRAVPVRTAVSLSRSPPRTAVTAPARIPPGPSTSQRWKAMRWKRWEMKSPALRGRFIGSPQKSTAAT